MTGSVALDVVIGLVFIFLLYSLLATIVCEIVAVQLGLRERNLHHAVRRMLEDFSETSENKLLAYLRQIRKTISDILFNNEGPGTCVFYHLPVIKYLARNTFHSKPAYITPQNFSKAMLEIFRRYGGADQLNDLQRIQNVLNLKLQHTDMLKELKDAINLKDGREYTPSEQKNYDEIFAKLKELIEGSGDKELSLDTGQRKIFYKISELLKSHWLNPKKTPQAKKAAVYKIDEMLNLFGHETRSHLLSLLRDSNNDLLKFRLQLEQWFDDTMDRASGWYKQKIQFVLLIIGFLFAISFNANTLNFVRTLSVDREARDKLLEMATQSLNDPDTKLVVESIRNPGDTASIAVENRQAKLDSLKALQRQLQDQLKETNFLLGSGWIDLPDSLRLMQWSRAREDSLRAVNGDGRLNYATIFVNDVKKKMLVTLPRNATNRILSRLDKKESPNGEAVFTSANASLTKIKVNNSTGDTFLYILSNVFSVAIWGYLLTALAISLGAPFWFDLLNRLVQIRGAVREPTRTQAGMPASLSTPTNTSDPSHPLNRKG